MYPNGVYGEGVVQMEVVTNNMYRDTISYGQVKPTTNIESLKHKHSHKLTKITDVYGRDVSDYKNKNQPLFYIYDEGTVEKLSLNK